MVWSHVPFSGGVVGLLVGLSLLAGVAANATLFTRVPVWLRIAAIFVPWITYATFLFSGRPVDFEKVLSVPYFFPWAVGIALVNVARIRKDMAQLPGLTIGSSDRGTASSVSQGVGR